MNWGKSNRLMVFTFSTLFVLTGTYNAVVINSESHIDGTDVKFVKRLDEIYGVTVQGREVAATVTWQKLGPSKIVQQPKQVVQTIRKIEAAPQTSAPVEETPVAAVQEELSLSLVEVINPKKWQNGLTSTQFNGSLTANQGVIEELSVALPNGEGLSVSFSEMTGNVFEYDFNGELYSGMMYQVDQHAYMVTLTNGPLEGTRLRFSSMQPGEAQANTEAALAQNNVDIGQFGNNADQYGNNSEQYGNTNYPPQEIAQPQPVEYVQAQEFNQQAMNQVDQQIQQQSFQEQGGSPEQSQAM